MSVHRLINTPAELDEAIDTAYYANDTLVLRDCLGATWEWNSEHTAWKPGQGWGAFVEASAYPFLVLWWPGSVIVPKGSVEGVGT